MSACSRDTAAAWRGGFARVVPLLLSFALLCCAMALVPTARAEGEDAAQGASGALEGAGIGELADRYESLDELANSLNPDDSVVVETRIGVLNSVNRALDGTTVRFSGEVVGTAVKADDGYKWVQVADQADSPIAVYLADELAAQIASYGDYNTTGTTLRVTGEYHVACPQHQGELEVHATRIEVADAGGSIVHGVKFERLAAGAGLCAAGLVLVLVFVLLRRRSDKLRAEREEKR